MILFGPDDEELAAARCDAEARRASGGGGARYGVAAACVAVLACGAWAAAARPRSALPMLLGGVAVFLVTAGAVRIAAVVAARRRLRRALETLTHAATKRDRS